jgi:hypothetical protein
MSVLRPVHVRCNNNNCEHSVPGKSGGVIVKEGEGMLVVAEEPELDVDDIDHPQQQRCHRLRPLLARALSILIADVFLIAYDVLYDRPGISTAAMLVAVAANTLISVIAVSALRTMLSTLQGRVRAAVDTALQTFAGYVLKGAIDKVISTLESDVQVDPTTPCLWKCFAISAISALVISVLACATVFLPSTPASKGCSRAACVSHLSTLVIGATALPLAYTWNFFKQDLTRAMHPDRCVSPSVANSSAATEVDNVYAHWAMVALIRLIGAVFFLLLCTMAKCRIQSAVTLQTRDRQSAAQPVESRRVLSRLTLRIELLTYTTFDFLVRTRRCATPCHLTALPPCIGRGEGRAAFLP